MFSRYADRLMMRHVCLCVVGLLFWNTCAANLSILQADIKAELEQRIRAAHPNAEVVLQWQQPAALLVERHCSTPQWRLQGRAVEAGQLPLGRIPIKINCHGTKPWAFYLQMDVGFSLPVLTAARAIARGTQITMADLNRTLLPLRPGVAYLYEEQHVIGQVVRQSIRPGSAILQRQLTTPYAVRRGEQVTIQAKAGSATITTTGEALNNGHVGEQVAVRNVRSKRVIKPWVIARGLVSATPPTTPSRVRKEKS